MKGGEYSSSSCPIHSPNPHPLKYCMLYHKSLNRGRFVHNNNHPYGGQYHATLRLTEGSVMYRNISLLYLYLFLCLFLSPFCLPPIPLFPLSLRLSLLLQSSPFPFLNSADIMDRVAPHFTELGLQYECVGGGRIKHSQSNKTLHVYGYSVVSTNLGCQVKLRCRSALPILLICMFLKY